MIWQPAGEEHLKICLLHNIYCYLATKGWIIRFDRRYERDRQTEGQKDTAYDGIGRACIASRGKK